jgi:pyruvate,orthophosphate dikinase
LSGEPLTCTLADGGDASLLGGKGAGLAAMVALGLPVPPAFVVTTAVGRAFLEDDVPPPALDDELSARLGELERETGRRLGDPQRPLLVSVRSGAPISMPGMMDTVLNVGLGPETVEALARETGDASFAQDCWVRLLSSWARLVAGIGVGEVEGALIDASGGSAADALLDLLASSGSPFPLDPRAQIEAAVEAVLASWKSPRAKAYRRHLGIDAGMGTAVVVQAMVFGNRGPTSGSGVAFSRDPSSGQPGLFGDYLANAQGEDVVAGEHDTGPLPDLPGLADAVAVLERHHRDLCEVELTVEDERLWILQTRVGQRSGRAAVRVAVDLVDEGVLAPQEAVERVGEEQLAAARAPVFATAAPADAIVARGVAASPGAAVGRVVFDPGRAQALQVDDEVVLLRATTSPNDVHGMIAAQGVVTGRGGRTSHAAVVARGLGRPAVCGVGAVEIDPGAKSATVGGVTLQEGEMLSVDGDRGIVARGRLPLAPAEADARLERLLAWREEFSVV